MKFYVYLEEKAKKDYINKKDFHIMSEKIQIILDNSYENLLLLLRYYLEGLSINQIIKGLTINNEKFLTIRVYKKLEELELLDYDMKTDTGKRSFYYKCNSILIALEVQKYMNDFLSEEK